MFSWSLQAVGKSELARQLRAASRPFPSLRDDLIIVQDYRQVSRYFLDKTTPHTENHNVAEMCGRCQSEITMSKSLSISKKDGHVELAIACLTHLNNRLFQARAGLLADFNMETATIPLAGASENRGREASKPLDWATSKVEWDTGNHDMGDESDSDDLDFAEYLALRQTKTFYKPDAVDVDYGGPSNSVPSRYDEIRY